MPRRGVALFVSLIVCLLAGSGSALAATGSISGTVKDAQNSQPLAEVEVCAFREATPNSFEEKCAETVSGGTYTIENLHEGSYDVEFFTELSDYAPQFWNDALYLEGAVSASEDATSVPISSGQLTVTGINANLTHGGSIGGTVTAESSGAPLQEILICAFPIDGDGFTICEFSNGTGHYTISHLASGHYAVAFAPGNVVEFESEYVEQFYSGKSSFESSTKVLVTAPGGVTGINAALAHKPVQETTTKPSGGTAVGVSTGSSQPMSTVPAPKPLVCKKGFKKKKVMGKAKCVKAHKAKHHGKKHRRLALLDGYFLG
jgi:Carboxypeptidase regulatory-like domain